MPTVKTPSFKVLELSDRPFIEAHTSQYAPYSDYNFTSLWSWNTRNAIHFGELNGNLVIQFTDYITGQPFYSFLGKRAVTRTALALLRLAKSQGLPPLLKLLPAESVRTKNNRRFIIKYDPDNFDYILSTKDLMTYPGRSLRGKRNFVNRFRKLYRSATREFDLADEGVQRDIRQLFHTWAQQKELDQSEVENEFAALSRLFHAAESVPLISIGVFVDNQLIGFSISEVLNDTYSILHFTKARAEAFVGVYPYLMQETARELAARGCRYLNYEQDLGLEGLREAKKGYHPCAILKKYTLTPRLS